MIIPKIWENKIDVPNHQPALNHHCITRYHQSYGQPEATPPPVAAAVADCGRGGVGRGLRKASPAETQRVVSCEAAMAIGNPTFSG